MQKRGQSQIIVTILLILLVLASVIIVWNVINSFLESGSSEIGIEGLVTKVEITSAKYYLAGGVEVVVRYLGGNIDSINFIFYDSDGLTKVIEKTDNIPGELETSTYSFTLE